MDIKIAGHAYSVLLDTGCDHSIIPRRMVPHATLTPVNVDVHAANGTKINVLGAMKVRITVSNIDMTAALLVSDEVYDFMLGYDWLVSQEATWEFGTKTLILKGVRIPMRLRKETYYTRRVFVRERTTIPQNTEQNVPVRMTYGSLRTPDADWVLDPKTLADKVFTARVLLPGTDNCAAVRVINLSNKPYVLDSGMEVGQAAIARVLSRSSTESPQSPFEQAQVNYGEQNGFTSGREYHGRHRNNARNYSNNNWRQYNRTYYQNNARQRNNNNRQQHNGTHSRYERHLGPRHAPYTRCNMVRVTEQGVFNDNNSHLQPIIDSLPSDLTVEERNEAINLLFNYNDVFSRHEYDLGRTTLMEHRIDTGNARPIRQQLRRHPQTYLNVIDTEIEKMAASGVIEPSCSPWASNVVVVTKHDKTPRITLDYRKLNEVTYKDSNPLPNIADCLDAFKCASFFGVLDLRSSFYPCRRGS